ncbi:MAG: multidrug efflux SMR transporter [Candidatus Methanoplasma sp.]|jgi:quaternary ammonium compound-resistance protein SugE|nr:multidrug efflux SMR transporter [Candidatus Methanoplasma sp.]
MNPWAWVMVGGVFETAWAVTMKLSDGFSDLWWTAATVAFIGCSVYLLDRGLRKIPVGGGYAVWVGIGAIGSIVMGVALFGEGVGLARMASAAAIVAGIIGLELTHKPAETSGD